MFYSFGDAAMRDERGAKAPVTSFRKQRVMTSLPTLAV